jgi:hypothetical protein
MYYGVYPDDLLKLDALLKSLAHRLAGTKNPDDYEVKDVTFANKEVRPFLKRLAAAHSDASEQLKLVKSDRPKLESRRAEGRLPRSGFRGRPRSMRGWRPRRGIVKLQLAATEKPSSTHLKLIIMQWPARRQGWMHWRSGVRRWRPSCVALTGRRSLPTPTTHQKLP